MKALVVGAGAVGQVYAGFLQAGGAEVAFRVRDRTKVTTPFRLYPLRGDRAARVFEAPVLDDDPSVTAFAPDLVLLTVPNDALQGEWLASLLAASGRSTVVALEPGREAADLIRAAKHDVELTQGVIVLIAYQAPLPGEPGFDPPGIAYWIPPGTAAPFEGPAAEWVSKVLSRGGMKAAARTGIGATSAYGSAAMGIWIAALRSVGWSLARMKEVGSLASRATREANEALWQKTGERRPFALGLLGPLGVRTVLWVGNRILPLPLETYLRVHFTKVGRQMEEGMRALVSDAERYGVPAPALIELTEAAYGAGQG